MTTLYFLAGVVGFIAAFAYSKSKSSKYVLCGWSIFMWIAFYWFLPPKPTYGPPPFTPKSVSVSSYKKSDGTVVSSHSRTSPGSGPFGPGFSEWLQNADEIERIYEKTKKHHALVCLGIQVFGCFLIALWDESKQSKGKV